MYFKRLIEDQLTNILSNHKSIWLLGARQTGKTTLIKNTVKFDLDYNFSNYETRLKIEKNPNILLEEIEFVFKEKQKTLLIFLDEIQKVPQVIDSIQTMIDNKIAQFILSGSSSKKLKHKNINLLPGRALNLHLTPFSYQEICQAKIKTDLNQLLIDGSLPEIFNISADLKNRYLSSYYENYIEEEIRSEALVRNVGNFANFLELAAIESGQVINMNKLSQDIGVAQTTIADYYQILEDCLISYVIKPFLPQNSRRNLTKAKKYLFFDLGVRRICAKEGSQLSAKTLGNLFEQWVGIELFKLKENKYFDMQILFWRDHAGPEVDYVIKYKDQLIPIEVKWTENPNLDDARHLNIFMKEYQAPKGFIISRASQIRQLTNNIIILPWTELERVGAGFTPA